MMTFNPIAIVQEVRDEFDELLNFVMIDAQEITANQVERHIFRQLLQIGLLLLKAFFQMRCHSYSRQPIVGAEATEIPYLDDRERTYFSIFGKLKIARPYFYKRQIGGRSPLDAALGLGDDSYSDLLREMHNQLSVYLPYEKAVSIMSRFFCVDLSKRVTQKMVIEDAAVATCFYEQKNPPLPEQEAEILVIQTDGKGVPLVLPTDSAHKIRLGKGEKRSRKKEAVVTTVYSIATRPRKAIQVVNSLFRQNTSFSEPTKQTKRPQNKQVWATLQGKETALDRLQEQVGKREGSHIQHRVALCDGDKALQSRIEERFDQFVLILDFIHAQEYLWKAANSLLGDTNPRRDTWMQKQTLLMLSSKTEKIVDDFCQQIQTGDLSAKQTEILTKTANYFERNLPYMDYATYLHKGWPIASGVIEGACRHLVKDRMELSGMRWQLDSAETLLNLRAVAENGDWDAYHAFRRRKRQQRLYGNHSLLDQQVEYHELPLVF
ncbi:MAG: ISKra4 family transposase [Chloroflexi bacterium]|nr:ISKra4 family transposase [Chloroflexota bacterium]